MRLLPQAYEEMVGPGGQFESKELGRALDLGGGGRICINQEGWGETMLPVYSFFFLLTVIGPGARSDCHIFFIFFLYFYSECFIEVGIHQVVCALVFHSGVGIKHL